MVGNIENRWVGLGRAIALVSILSAQRIFAAGGEVRRPADNLTADAVRGETRMKPPDTVSVEMSCPDVHRDPIATPELSVMSERELRGQDGRLRHPLGVAAGTDGSLWLSVWDPGQIIRIRPNGRVDEVTLSHAGALPARLAPAADGGVWFTDFSGAVGRVTRKGSVIEYYLDPASQPLGIALSADGSVYFTEYGANRIGRISAKGVVTEYDIPTPDSLPTGIAVAEDGSVWFTEFRGNQIGRLSPEGEITEYSIPTSQSHPVGIVEGEDGALYFTEYGAGQIGRITVGGEVTEFPLSSADVGPFLITASADGHVYFTESRAGRVGRLSMDGELVEVSLGASDSLPLDLVAAPNGIWVSEWTAGRIAHLFTVSARDPTEERSGRSRDRRPMPF